MSVLGYNLPKVYEGRGPLEAASIGVDLKPGEMAMRCNLICVEGEILKNHSSGHISTEEADVLIQYLQEKLGNDRVRFHTGVQYRHLLVIKGGNKELDCTPPHDVPLKPFRPLMVKPLVPEAQETADLINDLILKSQELLKNHPLNLKRMSEGKDPANSIWPWRTSLWRLPYCPTILLPANFAPILPILYRSLSGIRASNRMKCRRMTRYRHATAVTVC